MRTFVPDFTCWSLLLTALAIRLRYKPMYDKLRVLIINKDVRKSLARKNENESSIWSWNNSPPYFIRHNVLRCPDILQHDQNSYMYGTLSSMQSANKLIPQRCVTGEPLRP